VTSVACSGKCGSSTVTGYAVVDPLPRPVRTTGAAVTIKASVKWIGTELELELKDPTMPGVTYVAAGGPRAGDAGDAGDAGAGYSAIGAIVTRTERTSDGLKFVLEPDPGRGAVYVRLDVDGPDGPGVVQATVSWGATQSDAQQLLVTMDDR
jgi:hypothetical protein